MIQFSEDYNAQTIFDQVWEAPYEWFDTDGVVVNGSVMLPCNVYEVEYSDGVNPDRIATYPMTVEKIEAAVLKHYLEYVSKITGSWARPMSRYLEDLDANDVDAILQLACFGEIRYG